jgi:hypothetical protein
MDKENMVSIHNRMVLNYREGKVSFEATWIILEESTLNKII